MNLLWVFTFRADWKKVYLTVTGLTKEANLELPAQQPMI